MSGDTDGEDGLFTKDNLPTLVAFFLFVFSSGAFMSLITPFLPLELTKCGARAAMAGGRAGGRRRTFSFTRLDLGP